MSRELTNKLRAMDDHELTTFAVVTEKCAKAHQRCAARAQGEANSARREMKRRRRAAQGIRA